MIKVCPKCSGSGFVEDGRAPKRDTVVPVHTSNNGRRYALTADVLNSAIARKVIAEYAHRARSVRHPIVS